MAGDPGPGNQLLNMVPAGATATAKAAAGVPVDVADLAAVAAADAAGLAPADPLAPLARTPWAFDFHHAVRLIEAAVPGGAAVGYARRPEDDKCRFRHRVLMSFAPASVARFNPGRAASSGGGRREPPTLWTHFLGLLGAEGPMPPHLARLEPPGDPDPVLPGFFDVFHHRMLSLFYRAWADGEMAVNYQHAAAAAAAEPTTGPAAGSADRFRTYIGSLFGLGSPAVWDRDAVPDAAKLHYAGRLACPTRNAEGLAAILADFFAVPVAVEPFVREWVDVPDADRCRLGGPAGTSAVGTTAVLGDQVLAVQHRFRLVLGPMSLADYHRLLPGGDGFGRLRAWVLNYVGVQLGWDAQLVLDRADVPPCTLGHDRRLGLTAWLGDWPADRGHADDLTVCGDLN